MDDARQVSERRYGLSVSVGVRNMDLAILRDALTLLGETIPDDLAPLRLHVIGGTALSLLSVREPSQLTRDIDAVDVPTFHDLLPSIQAVSQQMELNTDWLNHKAAGFVRGMYDFWGPSTPFETDRIRVSTPSPQCLLALKVRTDRRSDDADILLLADSLGIASAEQVIAEVHDIAFGNYIDESQ